MRAKWVVVALALSLMFGASAVRADPPVLRVLFVGNSYTRHNDLPEMVERIGRSNGVRIYSQLAFLAGATLREQWRTRTVARYLAESRFTHVVLQGHSLDALERPEELAEYMRRFKRAADNAGAETILYQTWAREEGSSIYREGGARDPEDMQARISEVYGRIGRQLGARVAPVGEAWQLALHERPDARLYFADGSHPSRLGSYLAACVLFGALTGNSPDHARYRPHYLDNGRAQWFRQVATRALHPTMAQAMASTRERTHGDSEAIASALSD
jgi:hypothetical protein